MPKARQFTDAVRTFAYGTDASFYRLNPKLVVKVHTEDEIARILPIAHKHQVPVTFRAAGTSLSGQAITDSVLLKLSHTGRNFRSYTIHVRAPLLAVPVMCARAACAGRLLLCKEECAVLAQLHNQAGSPAFLWPDSLQLALLHLDQQALLAG